MLLACFLGLRFSAAAYDGAAPWRCDGDATGYRAWRLAREHGAQFGQLRFLVAPALLPVSSAAGLRLSGGVLGCDLRTSRVGA